MTLYDVYDFENEINRFMWRRLAAALSMESRRVV